MSKTKKNKNIGVFGYGAVGKALCELYKESCFGEPVTKDLDHNDFDYSVEMDVLNICIAYNDDFIDVVSEEIEKTNARLTIIYSSVAPFTTKSIKKNVKRSVVHSPVRGPHSKLIKGLEVFTKYIGAEDAFDAKKTKEHFKFLPYKRRVGVYTPAVTTEINKLISTTYFGVCISFADYVKKLCEIYNIPYKSFEDFNESYNRGYRRLKMRKVNRPTLFPPKGKIGGNCVVPNAKLLQKSLDSELIQSILKIKK